MATTSRKRRAVGVVRVSRVGGREGESFVSPSEQAHRIEEACNRERLRLVEMMRELDVSGGAPLERRPGLRRAVELVEAGQADVIVVAYMDRLVRSLRLQLDIVERIERAGGEILTLDHGALTNGNAVQRLSAGMLGLVNEYQRAATAERTQEAKERAVARGVPPFPHVPPGYRRGGPKGDGPLELDEGAAPAMREAFRRRAEGASITEVRAYLTENGIRRSFYAVQRLLASRIYLGELRHGEAVNRSLPALIDAATWERVQRLKLPRGRRSKSERLLARLAVARCGTCDSRLTIGHTGTKGKRYPFYRCYAHDCPRRVSISASVLEQAVEVETRRLLAGLTGRASADTEARSAEAEHERRQEALDAATRVALGAGIESEPAALERLRELREARDEAAERVAELAEITEASLVIDPGMDWNLLTLEERRALIRAVLASVSVAPGRGSNRLSFEPRSQ
jgi:DNA invertase Pin-like site-specific DNA recombinase